MVIRVMKLQEYKVLGHKIQYSVPETSTEFNALDPKRADAACEEAVSNIVYRTLNPFTRYWFLHGRSAEDNKDLFTKGLLPENAPIIVGVEELTGIDRLTVEVKGKDGKVRMKDGVAVTKYDEAEEAFYNRVLATLVKEQKFASEDLARAHFQDLIAQCASEVKFDVSEREAVERGPKKLAAKYKNAAAKSITLGRIPQINERQLKQIGKEFVATNDTTKMFAGSFLDGEQKEVAFNVSDKDAEALGWLLKEFFDWKNSQELVTLGD